MTEATTAERRTLITEALIEGEGALILRTPVLVEAGQRYWVDMSSSVLVVEDESGQHRFEGDYETRCY
jgi:hypothetical protein